MALCIRFLTKSLKRSRVVVVRGWEEIGELFGDSFVKALVPRMSAPPSLMI